MQIPTDALRTAPAGQLQLMVMTLTAYAVFEHSIGANTLLPKLQSSISAAISAPEAG